jgi:hypothetical protein
VCCIFVPVLSSFSTLSSLVLLYPFSLISFFFFFRYNVTHNSTVSCLSASFFLFVFKCLSHFILFYFDLIILFPLYFSFSFLFSLLQVSNKQFRYKYSFCPFFCSFCYRFSSHIIYSVCFCFFGCCN